MFALVESGSVTKFFKGNKGVTIGDIQYPKQIFQSWSNSELQAIGIYPVRIDTTNKKDEAWYINTNITYAVDGDEVVGSYGTATAKEIEDRNATDEDGVELDPVVVIKGLKTIKKEMIDQQCAGILAPSDWRVIKAKETSTTMDSGWKTWRASVRTKCNSMQDQIDGATNVDELKALFEYTEQDDGSITRPLGEFPEK
jgi:hypothetical protein|tara:strand:- start:1874 stop:2467 length:594 start_codon:yes stop_codon:yes gene_type:complete